MYKTYSYCLGYDEIQNILENKGYIVKTFSKVIDMIPELKKRKKVIFRHTDSMGRVSERIPSAFKTIKLAWKIGEEHELFLAVEELEKKYQGGFGFRSTLCKQDIFISEFRKFYMEEVLGKMIKEQVDTVIK